jgi:signal transduction histidine kinase/CheY-like chemotaxis protein
MAMFRSALTLAFGALLAVALVCAGLAMAASWGAGRQLERTRLAYEVLELHLELDAMAYALFEELTDGVRDLQANEEARDLIQAQFGTIRAGIAAEVAFLGGREDEGDELERLAQIERRLQRVLDRFDPALDGERRLGVPVPLEEVLRREIDDGFRLLMDEAIAEEREEVATAEAQARAWLQWVDRLSKVAALGAVVVGLGSVVVLRRRLDRPLAQLAAAADRVAAGDLGHRVPVVGDDEFARLGMSFNHMTEQIAAGQATTEAARMGLEQAVEARTAELGEANAELRGADERRRRFLADVSHELRTPLAAIRGEADVTLRARDGREEDYRTALARISEQATLSAALVDDLLFMARADGNAPHLRVQPVSLPDVVRRAADDVAVLAREHDVRIEVSADEPVEVVQGDPGRLRQLVVILLDNAVRYSRPGGIVEVIAATGPSGAVLQVCDHGIGIAEGEVGRIFDRFYRGSRRRGPPRRQRPRPRHGQRDRQGARRHDHGGQPTRGGLDLRRRVPVGAAHPGREVTDERDPAPGATPSATPTSAPPGRALLVVEDQERVANFLVRGLRAEGYAVTHCADGTAALGTARGGEFAAILFNVMLSGPVRSGICRARRAEGDATPILMRIALDAVERWVEGLRMGGDYLTKPVAFDEFVARVQALVRRAGASGPTTWCCAWATWRSTAAAWPCRAAGGPCP